MQAPTRESARRRSTAATQGATALLGRLRRSRLADYLRSHDLVVALLAAVLALMFGWQGIPGTPEAGLDPAWGAALHLAVQRGQDFGPDIAFTYGPLGFLKLPTWWGNATGAGAIAYTVVTRLALLMAVFAVARRHLGLPVAALLVLVVSALVVEPVIPLAFAGALWVVMAEPGDRRRYGVLAALGALAGVELLGKFSSGATVLALGVLAALFTTERQILLRSLAAFAGPALVVGLVIWLAFGQPLGAIPEFVAHTREIVSGYGAAMSFTPPGRGWQQTAAVVAALVGAAGLWWLTEGAGRRRRAGALILWAALSWLVFKQGFVRQDAGVTHVPLYFASLFMAMALVPWSRALRRFAVVALIVPFVALIASDEQRPGALFAPLDRFERMRHDLGALSAGERRKRVLLGRLKVHVETGVEPETLALLRGRGVHVWPTETSVIAAHDLDWQPLPVFQNYQAYTPALDDLNSEALLGDDAPERILINAGEVVDGRVPAWDPPRQVRALLCRYRPIGPVGRRWLVLQPGTNRCGPERRVASVEAAWGEPVGVPRASATDRMVILRLRGADASATEALRSFLYKPYERAVSVNDDPTPRRLVAATAEQGLVMSVPRSITLPPPAQILPEPVRGIKVTRGGNPGKGRVLRYDFYEIPVRG